MANDNLPDDREEELDEELESGQEGDGIDEDRRTKEGSEDQHEDHQDGDAELSEEEREEIRKRRREERQRKKQRQQEREESLRREIAARDSIINEMNQRLSIVERKSTGSEMAQLDAKIKEASDASSWFKDQIAVASAEGNHRAVAEATEKLLLARQEAERLTNIKSAYSQQQQRPQTLDPRIKKYGEEFMSEHRWLDLNGRDMDSKIALNIDQNLTQSGWDPRTPQYWEEYRSQLKRYLPHRYNSASVSTEGKRESRKSVVTGSGRESTSGASKGEYNLSPDRVQALKDAGAWDNPERRAKMIKAYREYDKQNRS